MRKPSSPAISIRSAVSYRMRAYSRFSKLFQFSFWERVSEAFEVDLVARDDHAFHAQAHPLLQSVLAGEANLPACADHTMPRNIHAIAQSPDHLPRRAGMSARRGDIAVCRDPAFRNSGDGGQDLLEHKSVLRRDFFRVIHHDCVERSIP